MGSTAVSTQKYEAKITAAKLLALSQHAITGNFDEEHFISCKFENEEMKILGEKNFKIFDTHNFIYDFTPDTLSEIRNMADPLLMNGLTSDRLGRSRMGDDAPDAGCYEYIMPAKE